MASIQNLSLPAMYLYLSFVTMIIMRLTSMYNLNFGYEGVTQSQTILFRVKPSLSEPELRRTKRCKYYFSEKCSMINLTYVSRSNRLLEC